MAEEAEVGCARPTGGPVGEEQIETQEQPQVHAKEERSMVTVG